MIQYEFYPWEAGNTNAQKGRVFKKDQLSAKRNARVVMDNAFGIGFAAVYPPIILRGLKIKSIDDTSMNYASKEPIIVQASFSVDYVDTPFLI